MFFSGYFSLLKAWFILVLPWPLNSITNLTFLFISLANCTKSEPLSAPPANSIMGRENDFIATIVFSGVVEKLSL